MSVRPRPLNRVAACLATAALALAGIAPAAQASPVQGLRPPLAATAPAGLSEALASGYVTQVYVDLFDRQPDPGGLARWTRMLTRGTPRVAVANAITSSTEFRAGLVRQAYVEYLGRQPDPAGLASWTRRLNAGMNVKGMQASIISSAEYYARSGGTDAGFVRRLYRDVLDRDAAAAEVRSWTGRMRMTSAGRGRVARGFLLSTENLRAVVSGFYQAYLGRAIDPAGRAHWVSAMQSGAREEQIIGGIIASAEYLGRVARTPTSEPTPPQAVPTGPTTPTSPPAPSTSPSGTPFIAYSEDSYFRSTVTGARIDEAATSRFHQFMTTHPDQAGTAYPVIRGVGGNQWGTAYAEGKATDPVWRLTGSVPAEVAALATTGFHAPEWFGAMLTGTSDSPFVVIDRATGISVWAAKSQVVGDHLISVGAAGYFEHASNGLDQRNPLADSDRNFRSRGGIPDAMVIRKDAVDEGIRNGTGLGHVLHLFMVETDSSAGFTHPMTGAESGKYGFGAEGQRIAIRSDIDLTRRGLSPEGLVIARTLQQHGAYIGDNSGTTTSLKAEQENDVRNVWGGRLTADALEGITWDNFVVLPVGRG